MEMWKVNYLKMKEIINFRTMFTSKCPINVRYVSDMSEKRMTKKGLHLKAYWQKQGGLPVGNFVRNIKFCISSQVYVCPDNSMVFEIGGKNKSDAQIKHVAHSYIAADNIETGWANKIPLWLFGLLY